MLQFLDISREGKKERIDTKDAVTCRHSSLSTAACVNTQVGQELIFKFSHSIYIIMESILHALMSPSLTLFSVVFTDVAISLIHL